MIYAYLQFVNAYARRTSRACIGVCVCVCAQVDGASTNCT